MLPRLIRVGTGYVPPALALELVETTSTPAFAGDLDDLSKHVSWLAGTIGALLTGAIMMIGEVRAVAPEKG